MTWSIKDIGLATVLSYVIMTILNYVIHWAFPSIGIVKSGIAILIFLIGVILACLWTFARDGSFSPDDVKGLLVVTAIVIAIYFGIRWALPDLFNIVPNGLKEVFSVLG